MQLRATMMRRAYGTSPQACGMTGETRQASPTRHAADVTGTFSPDTLCPKAKQ
ncbi:MAG TPA: hypothetical protein IAA99_05200 [Candidatus Avibacteroides faecavium]|nr:hypothetical protein [Candidatus Avibacteroides faecavium]